MNPKTVRTIFCKELVETLRDKRTLIVMIGIPVLLYPLMIIVMGQAAILQRTKTQKAESKIAVADHTPEPLREWLSAIPKVRIVDSDDPSNDLLAGDLDAVVVAEDDTASSLGNNRTAQITVQYDATESDSREALGRLREGLRKEGDRLLQERLEEAGLSKEFAQPLKIEEDNVAPPEKRTGTILGIILPMIMIIAIALGAFYPAIDLTAGEKERGTFETLLSTPTSKAEIICGKFLTVFCLSMITGLLNLGSMMLSMAFQFSQMASKLGERAERLDVDLTHVSFCDIALILLLLAPLAFFVCSVMMSIALLARDFKDAQNLVTPFLMLVMLPAMLAALPGIELSRTTMLIPIANVALLLKGLLTQNVSLDSAFGVFLSTGGYALLSLVVAMRLFQREDVILSEEKGLPLSIRRSAFVPRDTPTPGMSLVLFSITLLLLFYVGIYVQAREVISGILITEWCLILLPTILILAYTRVDLVGSLSLRTPSAGALLAAVLTAAGMLILATQIFSWQNKILPMPDWFMREMESLFDSGESFGGFLLLLAAFALSPAICEEVLFRGAILSGMRSKLSATMSVLVVSVLFGLLHVSVYRLLPTTLFGLVAGYLVLRSGSIFAGMLFHFLVNAAVVFASTDRIPAHVRSFLEGRQYMEKGFPAWLLAAAVVVFVAGVAILEITERTRLTRRRHI